MDDMYPIFKKAKDSKDTGGIHDFVEILKLYDKNEDKTILSKDLFRLLTNLGKSKSNMYFFLTFFWRNIINLECFQMKIIVSNQLLIVIKH